jgi:hypothetical protein
MNTPSFILTVTACEKPFWRGGFSLLLLFLIPIALGVFFIPDLLLPIRITLSICLCAFCVYYLCETIASLNIDMDNSRLVLTKTFYETTICLSDIQVVSFFVMPSSFYCEVLLKLKSGGREKFVFTAADTNLGSFSETIRILREKFGMIVDTNQPYREVGLPNMKK